MTLSREGEISGDYKSPIGGDTMAEIFEILVTLGPAGWALSYAIGLAVAGVVLVKAVVYGIRVIITGEVE
jgi:hypothetical protein